MAAFSSRVPSDLSPNRVTLALEHVRATGAAFLDLTETNPTRVGFEYPPALAAALADGAAGGYEPSPLGLPEARAAVAGDFARRGLAIAPDRIVLTAGTSEAYALLFKLLCDPGDRVLVPRPSYPLFDHLTRLDAVAADPYDLEYHGVWSVDLAGLARAIGPRTRAILAVSPNNPTGSYLKRPELEAIAELCRRHALALVGDEVFADYPIDPDSRRAASVLEQDAVLTFGLGGLSKSAGLPQMKLGWMAVGGPEPLAVRALARLEVVCDAYLTVSTPVQRAAPALIRCGAAIRRQMTERIATNYRTLSTIAGRHPACRLLRVEGGWSAVVQAPAIRSEEDLVLELLERDRVLAHPGYFFDFRGGVFVVVSLLPRPDDFQRAAARLFARAEL